MISVLPPVLGEPRTSVARQQRTTGRLPATLDLSLIVPTYNECENLEPLLARLASALAPYDFEVVLVDDDSPDGTWEKAEALRPIYPWLKVIRRQGERGLSSAVICGFRQARGQMLGVIDADLQHDETRLPDMLRALQHSDFAIATRRAEGGSDGKWSCSRRFTSWTATVLAKVIANVSLSDPMSGFFAMRRELFQAIDDGSLRPQGYKVLLYLYARAVQRFGQDGLRLSELGYRFGNRKFGRSKLSSRVIVEYILMLVDLRLKGRREITRAAFSPAVS